jgi:hypothetical protein
LGWQAASHSLIIDTSKSNVSHYPVDYLGCNPANACKGIDSQLNGSPALCCISDFLSDGKLPELIEKLIRRYAN